MAEIRNANRLGINPDFIYNNIYTRKKTSHTAYSTQNRNRTLNNYNRTSNNYNRTPINHDRTSNNHDRTSNNYTHDKKNKISMVVNCEVVHQKSSYGNIIKKNINGYYCSDCDDNISYNIKNHCCFCHMIYRGECSCDCNNPKN